MSTDLPSQIRAELGDLDPDAQQRVLEYVRSLKQNRKGMSGSVLKEFAGSISSTDAKSMIDAIEAGCEQVNLDEW
jgi:ATP-dependent protease HslVU (ClpYQ) peptidase subunit